MAAEKKTKAKEAAAAKKAAKKARAAERVAKEKVSLCLSLCVFVPCEATDPRISNDTSTLFYLL